ncbi:MAG TPA: pyridoxamine 5'-phosphate oxidase family protein [Microbacteriaceae bacterium]|nr:pyridoxamine 5'-phosphate oxidase family protein [Microbacteriaceae bacterium]
MSVTPEIPAEFADLLEIPVGTVTTIGANGYPQASAVWFLYEDGVVRTSLLETNQKVKNALANPKGTYLFVDPASGYRTIELRGDITIEPDEDVAFLTRQLVKYGMTPEEFGRGLEGRVIFTLTPHRVRTWG